MIKIIDNYKKCRGWVNTYNKKIFFVFLLRVIISFATAILIYVSSLAIADLFNGAEILFVKHLKYLILIRVLIYLISLLCDRLEIQLTKNINIHIKKLILSELFYVPSEKLFASGKNFNIIYSDSLSICEYIFLINNYIIQWGTAIIMLCVMYKINSLITIVNIIVIPVVGFISNKYGIMVKKQKSVVLEYTDQFIEYLKNIINNISDITINNYYVMISKTSKLKMETIKNEDIIAETKKLDSNYLINLIKEIGGVLVYIIGGYCVLHGNMQADNFIVISAYITIIGKIAMQYSSINLSLQQSALSIERVESIFNLAKERTGIIDMQVGQVQNISLRDVSVGYDSRELFSGLSYTFEKNNIYIISGRNGIGKTSLLKSMCQINKIDNGKIYLNDLRIDLYDYFELNNLITFVRQEPIIYYGLTIEDNILMGNEGLARTKEKMLQLCKYFEILDEIQQFEKGFDTVVDAKMNLSAGQRKKIQLIRCLLKEREIIIFDEPTANLDVGIKRRFYNYIDVIKDNKINIIVSHDNIIDINYHELELANYQTI